MRNFRDAKTMARALREALKAKAIKTTHGEALELIAKAFGCESWNILSAKIEATEPAPSDERTPSVSEESDPASPQTLFCSFCGKSQHEVRKLIAGPTAFICDECVDLCTDFVEPDDERELFRLMKGTEESGRLSYPALLDRARRMPTEELAHYVERGRKGVKRSRVALQDIERRLGTRDLEAAVDQHALATMQQEAQRELKQYEDALNIATTVLGERRQ